MSRIESRTLRDLLLHKLTPEEAEPLEDRIVQEKEMADRLETETADLIDDYARGVLSSETAKLVEEHLLTGPDAAQRLAFAKALSNVSRSHVDSRPERVQGILTRGRLLIVAPALAVCALALVFYFIYLRYSRVPQNPIKSSPQEEASKPQQPSSVTKPNGGEDTDSPFTIALLANQTRGGDLPTFSIPPGVRSLRIQCEVPAETSSLEFQMLLRDTSGRVLKSPPYLPPKQSEGIYFVQSYYPAGSLKDGRYAVSIFSSGQPSHSVASYNFEMKFRK